MTINQSPKPPENKTLDAAVEEIMNALDDDKAVSRASGYTRSERRIEVSLRNKLNVLVVLHDVTDDDGDGHYSRHVGGFVAGLVGSAGTPAGIGKFLSELSYLKTPEDHDGDAAGPTRRSRPRAADESPPTLH